MFREILYTSEVAAFPYIGDDNRPMTYLLIEKETGYCIFFRSEFSRNFAQEILDAIATVNCGKGVLYAVWQGAIISKVYLVDKLALLKEAVDHGIDIAEQLVGSPVNFAAFREKSDIDRKALEQYRKNYEAAKKKCEAFFASYSPDSQRYSSVKEIEKMIDSFVSAGSIRNSLKNHLVPYRYENRLCGKSYRDVMVFSLDEAIRALKKDIFYID